MLTKTLTYGLGKVMGFDESPIELSEEQAKLVYTELLKGFQDFAKLCNYATSLFFISNTLELDLKELGFNKSYGPILEKLKLDTHLNGKVLNQSYGVTKVHFTGDHGKRLKRGETSLPIHRADGTHPLYFHKDAVKLHRKGNDFYIVYNLFSVKWAKENNISDWIAFPIRLKKRDKTGISQLEKVVNEEWKKGSGQLVRRRRESGKKYHMHLSVKYEPQPYKEPSKDVVMGIDLGVNTPAVIHFRENGNSRPWAMFVGDGGLLLNARFVVRREIVMFLRALKKKDSPIQGKDREALLKKLRDSRRKEKRIIKTASQKIASTIADKARREGAGVWQMEAIGLDIKESKPWLARNWAPGVLIDAIRWQAVKYGADFKLINPKKTSQRCRGEERIRKIKHVNENQP